MCYYYDMSQRSDGHRIGPCNICGTPAFSDRCQRCYGLSRRKNPERIQGVNACADCGKQCRGTRCNPCWGLRQRGPNNPAWAGGGGARGRWQRRRARVSKATIETVDFNAIIRRDKGRCAICRRRVKPRDVSFDHIIPIAKGGTHAGWNLRLTHFDCNRRRSAYGSAQTRLPIN